jgi:hypothetical protein
MGRHSQKFCDRRDYFVFTVRIRMLMLRLIMKRNSSVLFKGDQFTSSFVSKRVHEVQA